MKWAKQFLVGSMKWAKQFLDRNIATVGAILIILCVLFLVPQIFTIWFELPYQMVARSAEFGDKAFGSLFIVFVAGLIGYYTAAWFAVIPASYLAANGVPRAVTAVFSRRNGWLYFWPQPWWALPTVPVLIVAGFPNRLGEWMKERWRKVLAVVLLLLAAGNFVFRWQLDRPTVFSQRWFPYPLAGSTCSMFGWIMVFWVCWWGYVAWRGPRRGRRFPPVLEMLGRIFALQFVALCLGEALWIAADLWPTAVSYRLYTIWAVFHLAYDLAVIAVTLDVLHMRFKAPFRPFVLFVGVLLLLFCPNFWRSFQPTSGSKETFEAVAEQPDWYDHLYRRILETDERAPVVIVASSGGGSRAALFTSLVLEALSNESLTDWSQEAKYENLKWGDQIVLMSSVSGGSLGNGYYAARLTRADPEIHRPRIRNSFATPLADQSAFEYRQLYDTIYEPLWEQYVEQASRSTDRATREWGQTIQDAVNRKTALGSDPNFKARYLESAFADDMCTDFMAPLFRGFMTPELERGRGLAVFWEQRFGWDGTNRRGFPYGGEEPGRPRTPQLLFNATEVGGGRRLVVGFPPLYPNTFHLPPPVRPMADEKSQGTVTLEDFSPTFELRLSEAVRMSSNFPWGIPPASMRRPVRPLKQTLNADQLKQVRDKLTPEAPPSLRPFAGKSDLVEVRVVKALYPKEAEEASLLSDEVSADRQRAQLENLVLWLGRVRFDPRVPENFRKWAESAVAELDASGHLGRGNARQLALDGGVNDNTGIPSLCELLEHLERTAKPFEETARTGGKPDEFQSATRADKAWLILYELRRRGVVLVEIDSGAKPSSSPPAVLSTVRVPIQGLENASYAIAGGDEDAYLSRIRKVVQPRQRSYTTKDVGTLDREKWSKSDSIIAQSWLYHLKFVCNHSTQDDVMTAWALAPHDKAKIYATFFCELREWQEIKMPWFQKTWQWAWEFRKDHPTTEERDMDRRFQGLRPPGFVGRKKPNLPQDTPAPSGGKATPQLDTAIPLDGMKKIMFSQKKE
jgi:hypothetical protein